MKKVRVLISRLQFKVSVILIFLEHHPQNEAPSMPVDDTVQTEQQSTDDDCNLYGYRSSESGSSGMLYTLSDSLSM